LGAFAASPGAPPPRHPVDWGAGFPGVARPGEPWPPRVPPPGFAPLGPPPYAAAVPPLGVFAVAPPPPPPHVLGLHHALGHMHAQHAHLGFAPLVEAPRPFPGAAHGLRERDGAPGGGRDADAGRPSPHGGLRMLERDWASGQIPAGPGAGLGARAHNGGLHGGGGAAHPAAAHPTAATKPGAHGASAALEGSPTDMLRRMLNIGGAGGAGGPAPSALGLPETLDLGDARGSEGAPGPAPARSAEAGREPPAAWAPWGHGAPGDARQHALGQAHTAHWGPPPHGVPAAPAGASQGPEPGRSPAAHGAPPAWPPSHHALGRNAADPAREDRPQDQCGRPAYAVQRPLGPGAPAASGAGSATLVQPADAAPAGTPTGAAAAGGLREGTGEGGGAGCALSGRAGPGAHNGAALFEAGSNGGGVQDARDAGAAAAQDHRDSLGSAGGRAETRGGLAGQVRPRPAWPGRPLWMVCSHCRSCGAPEDRVTGSHELFSGGALLAGQAGMLLGRPDQVLRPEDASTRQAHGPSPEAGRGAGRGRRRREARGGAPTGAGEAAEAGGVYSSGGSGRGGRARGAGGRGRGSGGGSHAAPGAKAPMRVLEARCPSLVALLGQHSGWPLSRAPEHCRQSVLSWQSLAGPEKLFGPMPRGGPACCFPCASFLCVAEELAALL